MTTLSTPELGKLTCNGTKPQGAHRTSSHLNVQYVKDSFAKPSNMARLNDWKLFWNCDNDQPLSLNASPEQLCVQTWSPFFNSENKVYVH
eukprot:7501742-Lingulodinium_polyedra.AAC.1